MRRVLGLAEKGRGLVHPNPMVGAVLVRNGRLVAEGYHHAFGQAHAEVEAIRKAGARAQGSTLYLNLEPCSHWGKTPPCVLAIVQAKVARVVAAMRDPNPKVSGKGFRALQKSGIQVTQGVLEQKARFLNRAFMTWVTKNRPYVTVKVASSLDGLTATRTGESKWITGGEARTDGHRLRSQVDAVAVGAETLMRDNPSLTAHGQGKNPLRVIFADRRLPRNKKCFDGAAPTFVLRNTHGGVRLKKALTVLANEGITHLLIEGGITLQRSFFEADLVDEVVWYLAPLVIGNASRLKNGWKACSMTTDRIGQDLRIHACSLESFKQSAK